MLKTFDTKRQIVYRSLQTFCAWLISECHSFTVYIMTCWFYKNWQINFSANMMQLII